MISSNEWNENNIKMDKEQKTAEEFCENTDFLKGRNL